jgi:sec-independent protein translocase protein TatA
MQDWMIVAVIGIVVLFGASKLPQIARNMGKAQGEFKKGLKEGVPPEEQQAQAQQQPNPIAPPPATSPTEPTATETPRPAGEPTES